MLQSSPRLKTLESLVGEATKRLKALADENRGLKAELDELRVENQRLAKEVKRHQGLSVRHDRVKQRIERLIHKIEKAEGVA